MPQVAIREFDGKNLLVKWLKSNAASCGFRFEPLCQIGADTDLVHLPEEHPWLLQKRLVAKPDQLIKRRGKLGLIKLNATWQEARQWIEQRRGHETKVERVSGVLDHFIVEPFVPHDAADEYYLAVVSKPEGDLILFHHEGGVDVGDVDAKAVTFLIPIGDKPTEEAVRERLLSQVPEERKAQLALFVVKLFEFYSTLNFAYLEINPLVMTRDNHVVPLDMAAKIDETAKFECAKHWGVIDHPPPFGRRSMPEEEYIAHLDSKTGSSLKLTVLNPEGRIWTMVAGGGASVVYADTLTDLGAGKEMANYGEYSGAPSESLTYEYAKTILDLMTRTEHPQGKILIIGGGIANFTNVADTFKGIIRALGEFRDKLKHHNTKIYVRRGGPNWQEGLNLMRQTAVDLDLPITVHGPDRVMTAVVCLALGKPLEEDLPTPPTTPGGSMGDLQRRLSNSSLGSAQEAPVMGNPSMSPSKKRRRRRKKNKKSQDTAPPTAAPAAAAATSPTRQNGHHASSVVEVKGQSKRNRVLFTEHTRAIVYGMQPKAVQNMLDFDFLCKRKEPSVACMVYPFSGPHYQKFYWKSEEILIPIFTTVEQAISKFPEVDTVVNFASFRSAFESTTEVLQHPSIRTIAIIAEGVPERRTRMLNKMARERGVTIIGPATVGGIKPGCFRIGNTGGMLDNILSSKLYRPGSVAYVTRSGGLSNEMNNIISQTTDGVYEGVAIGGDMYPGTTFIDHILRYQDDPAVKMIVVLGEVGGVEEYKICDALKAGRVTKPVVAWCIGTCAKMFPYEVQFGHAGACAAGKAQTADDKNRALRLAGAAVPTSFQLLGQIIKSVYKRLVRIGTIVPKRELPPPQIPVDYAWAAKLGLIRKPSNFVSSISDERGDELSYAGVPITQVFSDNLGMGGVLGLLWFRKRLPEYFCRFLEMVLMVTADHGPAVSGAHNTIVCARAGKDLISSLCSGLLTVGPRFGGALDGAAQAFSEGYDEGLTPEEFVASKRRKKELIMGIGHKIKSLESPDARVTIIKNFAKQHFKSTEVLDYALQVEQVTTAKKSNLILNVDGCIAVCFVDLMRSCGAFTREEAAEYIEMGTLNGLFVLGRSMGFVGHWIDQKRLKQGLYRHPTEDISYIGSHDLAGLH